jgi:hypothetical protein
MVVLLSKTFEVLPAVGMKSSVIMANSQLKVDQPCGGTCSACYLLHAEFLLRLLFSPKDGTNAEVKKMLMYTSTPPYLFMA